MRRWVVVLGVMASASLAWGAAPPVKGSKGYTREQAAWEEATRKRLREVGLALRFDEAFRLSRQRLALNQRVFGPDHWETRGAAWEFEGWRRLSRLSQPQRAELVRAARLSQMASQLQSQKQFADAEKAYRQSWEVHKRLLGEDHPNTTVALNFLSVFLSNQGRPKEALALDEQILAMRTKVLGANHPILALSYENLAGNYILLQRNDKARAMLEQALAVNRRVWGEDNLTTAQSYLNLGTILYLKLAQYAPAQVAFEKALAIRVKQLGEGDLETAHAYQLLATCLRDQAKHAQAQPLYEKALAIREKLLPPDDPELAVTYTHLGNCHHQQGRHGRAKPLFERALAIRRAKLGENDHYTAESYNNLAACFSAQHQPEKALPLLEKSLGIRLKIREEDQLEIAFAYHNLAACLLQLERYEQARELFRKAVALRNAKQGEEHPETVRASKGEAQCLSYLGRHAEAQRLYAAALKRIEKARGTHHPETAGAYNDMAFGLRLQGKNAEAEPYARQCLALTRETLGPDHPHTAGSYYVLAICLWKQGRRAEAIRLLQQSIAGQEAARFQVAPSGFERAEARPDYASPRAILAAGLAGLNQPHNAFAHAEASLARGLLDDLAAPSTEVAIRAEALNRRLAQLSEESASLAARTDLSAEQRTRRDELLRERLDVSSSLARLAAEHSARQVLSLARIQRSLRPDDALVLWIDVIDVGENWGCVVRREGKPHWERITGSGKGGAWTDADASAGLKLYQALRDPESTDAGWKKLAAAFAKRRLDPIRPHLKAVDGMPAVRRLFVVPAGPMAYVPADLLDEALSVSYVPSGSVLARLRENHRAVDGSSLLAVGDPRFEKGPPPEPPASGVFVKSVIPGGNAAKAGLRPGDVLLSIGDARLESYEDLAGSFRFPAKATYWRDGKTLAGRIPGMPFEAVFDERSARAAARAWRRGKDLRAVLGPRPKRLPGTSLEVEAVASLVKSSTKLLGSQASEQHLDELQAAGKMKTFRLLLFATHGETNAASPGNSALLLAMDALPDDARQAREGKKVYDGRLTVSAIRADAKHGGWDLDADLVVLSACETGLGKDAQGDGLLGFAQAFIHKGARAVVASRWKVDDAATSLLMIRFFENLLGKRKDKAKPMGRAASLEEAKKWLRTLPRKEAGHLAALYANGVLRGSEGDEPIPTKGKPGKIPEGDRPFAHPFFWAAFTLIGDPD